MSGHNKWSTIKRKKGALDAKRSKIFSRIIKEINIAIRDGGVDPEGNARLRLALNNARGANMPKDNIQRALTKADKDSSVLHEVNYEGYASNGIAIYIECLTDNPQRSLGNVRTLFNRRGGSLGANNSVAFMFERKGVIVIPRGGLDPDDLQLEIIDAGVEDFEIQDDSFVITTAMEDFGPVQRKLEQLGIAAENASLQRIATETKKLEVPAALKVLKFVDELEDDEDVQNVYHNMEVTDELLAAFE